MEPAERWQPIAPASDEPGQQQQRATPDAKKRRQAIAVACLQCRSGKAKCDGTRPRCTRCLELDLPCRFDVAEGVSRAERMKLLKRESMSPRAEEMARVIKALRTGSDDQATAVLARLRIGDRLDDIVKALPPSSISTVVSKPPSLLAQDSPSTPGSYVSTDATTTFTNNTASPYAQDTRASGPPILGQHAASGSHPAAPSPQSTTAKGKQPASTSNTAKQPFLSILFDREDYLRASSESDDEDGIDGEADACIDPRLLNQSALGDGTNQSMESPDGISRSQQPSPKKDQPPRYHSLTYLKNRQPIVDTTRIHANFSLRNRFGNLPFSSSVRTNNYPTSIQDQQVNNLFVPTWAMMPVNTRPDPGSLKHAFQSLYRDTTVMMEGGTPVEFIVETHPNIAALFDEDEYNKSGVVSRWAAGMVHSGQLKGNDFTAFASMYCVWYLARWMVSPSPETYEVMPDWCRPTPNQLFMPHISVLDFVPWPAFREYAVQILEMQERMGWLLDMSSNIRCDWYFELEECFRRDDETGMLDLCDLAKTSLSDLTSWSVGPSFRQYVRNADSYMRIRAEDF